MKHKLINIETKETHLCNKVSLGGFDYYVSDEQPLPCNPMNVCMAHTSKPCDNCGKYQGRNIIATTNPNIDCAKVVDEVEKLAKEHCEYWEFDRLLGSGSNGLAHDSFVFGYNKAKETLPFSEEDIIEFAEWVDNMGYRQVANGLYKSINDEKGKLTKELLQLWKEQKIKTIYFN